MVSNQLKYVNVVRKFHSCFGDKRKKERKKRKEREKERKEKKRKKRKKEKKEETKNYKVYFIFVSERSIAKCQLHKASLAMGGNLAQWKSLVNVQHRLRNVL